MFFFSWIESLEATPKTIMRVMGVKGLTLYHLKSHLQVQWKCLVFALMEFISTWAGSSNLLFLFLFWSSSQQTRNSDLGSNRIRISMIKQLRMERKVTVLLRAPIWLLSLFLYLVLSYMLLHHIDYFNWHQFITSYTFLLQQLQH